MTAEYPIHIPDYVVMFDPQSKNQLKDLAQVLAELLSTAEDIGGPIHACLSTCTREISLLVEGTPEAFELLARWSERFGGVVSAQPDTDHDGKAMVTTELRFTYLGAVVDLHAYVKPVTG